MSRSMEYTCVAALLVSALTTSSFASDSAGKSKEPELQNVFYFLDETGSLTELERHTAMQDVKRKSLGLRGAQVIYSVPGRHSDVRFDTGKAIRVVVRIAEGTDPRAFVQFVNLESKGKIRSFAAASTGPFGGDTKDLLTRGLIPFGVSKYATSSYVLELGPSLAPGEYSLSTTTSNTVFCFGIGKALN